MPIFSDTFTDTGGTCVINHTPTTGASWYTLFQASAVLVINSAGELLINAAANNQGHTVGAANSPTVNDFEIGFTFANTYGGTFVVRQRLLARLTDISNYYSAEFISTASADNDSNIYKKVAGVRTQLASVDTGLAASNIMLFRVTDENKVLYKNGACIISTNDNAITNLGLVGIGHGRIDGNDGGRSAPGWRVDDFVVQELDTISNFSAQANVY